MTACRVAPGDDGWCDNRPTDGDRCLASGVFHTEPFGCWCVREPDHTGKCHCACCCREWKAA